jgi:hypothetical protein
LFSEDAPSVAKEIARPTLHQIAEWPEQTEGAPDATKATTKEIRTRAKYFKKTWNFPASARVGIFKQLEFTSFPLTLIGMVNPLHFRQGNRHGHNTDHHSDPVTDRWFTGLPALQKLGLRPVRYHRRRIGGAVDPALAWPNINIHQAKKEALEGPLFYCVTT